MELDTEVFEILFSPSTTADVDEYKFNIMQQHDVWISMLIQHM